MWSFLFSLTQKQTVSESSKLLADLQASKTTFAELTVQLGQLQQDEIDAAVKAAHERHSELSIQLRVTLEAKNFAQRRLEQAKARFAYLSSFDSMVNAKIQSFEAGIAEDMMTLKDAASALSV